MLGDVTYIFPTERRPTFAAVDVAHGVVPGRHLPVIRLTLNHVHTAELGR